VRGEQVVLLSAIGLVVIGVDLLRQRRRLAAAGESPAEPTDEPATRGLDPARPE